MVAQKAFLSLILLFLGIGSSEWPFRVSETMGTGVTCGSRKITRLGTGPPQRSHAIDLTWQRCSTTEHTLKDLVVDLEATFEV